MENMGSLDMGETERHWNAIFEIAERLDDAEDKADVGLTARKFDEAQPAGHRAYMLASGHILTGLEHIDALRSLITSFGATPRAPWTLLRAVFEAGFWSTWLMEPDDGLTRRQRGL